MPETQSHQVAPAGPKLTRTARAGTKLAILLPLPHKKLKLQICFVLGSDIVQTDICFSS